jgi:hypothetical protein
MAVRAFTGEIVKQRGYVYAVFVGNFHWGGRGLTDATSLRIGLQWVTGQQRTEHLKALRALEVITDAND